MRNFKTLIAIVAATQLLNAVDSDKMFNILLLKLKNKI